MAGNLGHMATWIEDILGVGNVLRKYVEGGMHNGVDSKAELPGILLDTDAVQERDID